MRKALELPPLDYLGECFNLRSDGVLVWKTRPQSHFPTRRGCSIFNGQQAGKVAGKDQGNGYLRVRLLYDGKVYKFFCHRIVYALANGIEPRDLPEIIDHKDGNSLNNHPENLRFATQTQNQGNCKLHCTNKSGFKGVYWDKMRRKWIAKISIKNKTKYLGAFANKEEAYEVYCTAAMRRHGPYARLA